jgi:enolase-phosphatase E1
VQHQIRCILLDIEGTVAPISFVTEVMFPYVRTHLADFLRSQWTTASGQINSTLSELLQAIGAEAQATAAEQTQFASDPASAQQVAQTWVTRLMDRDAKTTALKKLQGQIWQSGFDSGQLVAQLFEEVPAVLSDWHQQGFDLRIYSSGSVAAQKLFFGHTQAGNLLHLFRDFYDTAVGGKRESESYRQIARLSGFAAEQILFCSDVVEELDAAAQAGMVTALSLRPGNPPQTPSAHRCFQHLAAALA